MRNTHPHASSFSPAYGWAEVSRRNPCLRSISASALAVLLIAFAPSTTMAQEAPRQQLLRPSALLPVNDFCPVVTDQIADPEVTVNYEDERIAFCCERCTRAFSHDPEAYMVSMASSASVRQEHAGHTGSTHDHANHGDADGDTLALGLLGKFHPLLIHFPIALVLAAGLAEILGAAGRLVHVRHVSRFMLALAALSAIPVIVSGWILADVSFDDSSQDFVLFVHRWAGVMTAGLILLTTSLVWWMREKLERKGARRLYWVLLIATMLAVSLTGHLGATLVYGGSYWGFPIPLVE